MGVRFGMIDLGAGATIKTIVFSANGATFIIGSGAVGSQTLTLEVAASKLPTADPDGDGINNLMEFVIGGSPVESSIAILPTQAIVGSTVVLSDQRSDESESPATAQLGQWSTNLSTWNDVMPE